MFVPQKFEIQKKNHSILSKFNHNSSPVCVCVFFSSFVYSCIFLANATIDHKLIYTE